MKAYSRSLRDGELWSYDLSGRPPIPIALPGDNRFPVWSPDSQQVAFARVDGVLPTPFIVPADGSVFDPEPLTAEVGLPKAWSATDELILLRPRLRNVDITARSTQASGEQREIVATEFLETDPALSPNGRWLAYASSRTGGNEIWLQEYPDGVAVRVSTNGGFEPRWSGDGRELYYLQGSAMMAVAVDTEDKLSFEAPQQLFAGTYMVNPSPTVSSYDVAPDGRFLMIEPSGTSADAAPASIVVVENWAEELKRLAPTR